MENQEEILDQVNGLKSLLRDTDHTANQIIEGLVETMQDATVVDFVAKFLVWMARCSAEYGQIIRKRAQWREKICELEQQMEEEDHE